MRFRSAVAGSVTATVLLAGVAGGLALDYGAIQTVVAQDAAQQPGPNRRAVIESLARLANISPRELQAAAAQHGGLLQALEAHGVDRAAVLDELTRLLIVRFEPAIEQGRLTREQAEQLARQQAQRLIRRLGQRVSPRRQ